MNTKINNNQEMISKLYMQNMLSTQVIKIVIPKNTPMAVNTNKTVIGLWIFRFGKNTRSINEIPKKNDRNINMYLDGLHTNILRAVVSKGASYSMLRDDIQETKWGSRLVMKKKRIDYIITERNWLL
jgi:hypothetical protein